MIWNAAWARCNYSDNVVIFKSMVPLALHPVNPSPAVDEIVAANGVTNRMTHLVYSHHHSDHGGAASLFGGDVVRIGHQETRRRLLRDDGPGRPTPQVIFAIFTRTTTFAVMQSLRLDSVPSGPVHP